MDVPRAGAGALVGPTIGSAIWRFSNRNSIALIDAREREFLQHIAKKRVDPTLQSPTNPIPDYYGKASLLPACMYHN